MTYCFRCPACGHTLETNIPYPEPTCRGEWGVKGYGHDAVMQRDYRAEAVGIGPGVRASREA